MKRRRWLLILAILPLVAACGSTPPQPSTPSGIDCGPLTADLCLAAVTVAEGTFPASHPPFISVTIEAPTPTKTCPPAGGPGPNNLCGVIATVTTVDGAVAVGLVRTDGGWMWTHLVK
jgi:hypothetical protein